MLALVHLPFPFGADQSFATVVGDEMRHGRVLYQGVWDVRQPGIYAFFYVGGSVFGATEVGVHLLETLYLLAFAVVLQRTLRARVENAWVAAVAPLFVIGAYWAAAAAPELTQIEVLVAFPLYISLWGVTATDGEPSARRLFLTGVAGAAVVCFKLFYLPIFAVVWALALVRRANVSGWRAAARELRWLFAGFAIPVAAVVVYFAAFGSLYELFWTTFVFPPRQRSLDLRNWSRLHAGLRFLFQNFVWTVPLAAIGVFARRPRRDPFVAGLLVWLVLGAGLLALQTWYPYQFQLLITPLGLLAIFGLDRLATSFRTTSRAPLVVVLGLSALLAFVPARGLARKTVSFVQWDAALTAEGRLEYHAKYAPWYPITAKSTAFLRRTDALPGPIHVFGDYELHRMARRRMAIAINGQTPEQLDDRLWRKTRQELAAAQPPYVFVGEIGDRIMRERSPETRDFLARGYCRLRAVDDGVWLASRRSGQC
ncbi:MAG: hypothetical protein QOI55_1123 [Actinomycetota bacterium]|nr:hypothetical protein [Actinomycetota bacterium]